MLRETIAILALAGGMIPAAVAAQEPEPEPEAVVWDVREIENGRMALADWGNGVPIFVRCANDRLDVIISLPVAIEGDDVRVQMSFDAPLEAGPGGQQWRVSESRGSIFSRLPEAFARDVASKRTLDMRISDGTPPALRVQLELPVDGGPVRSLMSECGVPEVDPLADLVRVTDPAWIRRPSGEDLAEFFPLKAWDSGVGGRAVIQCVVETDGNLSDCIVLEETPGLGYGAAAVQLATKFQMTPLTEGGVPRRALVNIPINWSLSEARSSRLR